MTKSFLAAHAPVFTIDGEIRGEPARDLVRLEVEESTAGLATLTARFVAQGPRTGLRGEGLLYLDGDLFDFGRRIQASLGPRASARTVFSGRVSGLEAAFHAGDEPEVVVFAEDELMSLRMTRRFRTYERMTDAQIAETIASEHGLAVRADVDGPTYATVQQWNMSDLAFLRDRARRVQAELYCLDGTLHFLTRDKRPFTELTLVQGNELLDVELRADVAHQRTSVVTSGYDASEREGFDESADAAAIDAEIDGGRTGAEVLERAFGARTSYVARQVPLNSGEAAAWARAEFLRRARAFVTVAGVTSGSPEMTVGSRLTLDRVGEPFNGPGYYVVRVRHTYDLHDGHRTHFVAERPTIARSV